MALNPGIVIGGPGRSPRRKSDHYNTPSECTKMLLRKASHVLPGQVWEPACGVGAISKVLIERGRNVVSTDLEDYGYGTGGLDFLNADDCLGDCIITNPPFSLAGEFIRKSARFGVPFAMLLKSTFWHAEKRRKLFEETGPLAIFAMTWRPVFIPELGKSSTMDFVWTVWDREPSPVCGYAPAQRV